MITEKKEKSILMMSFWFGLLFAIAEFIFAIFSHSQSALTDAVYDASELVFIALLLFLTPLFYQPVSEKHPYGFFQVESIFVIIKGVMMLSVTMGVSVDVIESAINGGNHVNPTYIVIFQLILGIASLIIYIMMKLKNKHLCSPTIDAELLGWKVDIYYSLGMALAFFVSKYLVYTPFAFVSPYFDQLVAVIIMVMMLPESIKVLWNAIKELFLFAPDEEITNEIKELSVPILAKYDFTPVFYDITKTGRHLWVAIYFRIDEEMLEVAKLREAVTLINEKAQKLYQESTCELILISKENN